VKKSSSATNSSSDQINDATTGVQAKRKSRTLVKEPVVEKSKKNSRHVEEEAPNVKGHTSKKVDSFLLTLGANC
jgi:hypothetical protein